MAWTNYADVLETADLSTASASNSQKFTPQKNIVLANAHVGIISHNPPSMTFTLAVYSDNGGLPGVKIATSTTTKTESDITSGADVYGFADLYFAFDNIPLRENLPYHMVIEGTGTLTSTEFIAWRKQWPETQYATQVFPGIEDIGVVQRHLFINRGEL